MKTVDKKISKYGVNTLFSPGLRVRRTGSIAILDFFDDTNNDEFSLISSIAIELQALKQLTSILPSVLKDMENELSNTEK